METFIFGDIEGNENIYNNTIKCINENFNDSKFIFLGDIYNFEKSAESLKMIKNIISYFYSIEEVINKNSEPLDVIRLFRTVWKRKNLKCCKTKYKQYWKFKPFNNIPNDYSDFKGLFIYGNKEVEFIYDIVNSKKISKSTNNNDVSFSILSEYFDTQEKVEKIITRIYTHEDLNIMYNYLNHCCNYYITGNVLYTHCYFNNEKFDDINVVVSGHNKGYGKFIDKKYNGLTVYIIDLTSSGVNYNNYISCDNDFNFKLFNNPILPKGLESIVCCL